MNRSTLMDRIKGCPEDVDAKSVWLDGRTRKQRQAIGIQRGAL